MSSALVSGRFIKHADGRSPPPCGPSLTRRDLESRIDRLIAELAARRANSGVTSGRQAIEEAAESLETRGIIVLERGRFCVRDRSVPRYYARTIEHLLVTTGRTH